MNDFKFEIMSLTNLVKDYFNIAVNYLLFDDKSRLDLLKSSLDGNDIILSIFDNKKIIAVCALEVFEKNIDFLYVKYITVDIDYRNQGLATFLMEEKFKYARLQNKGLVSSEFTKDGNKYLKEKDKHFAEKYNVLYFQSEKEYDRYGKKV